MKFKNWQHDLASEIDAGRLEQFKTQCNSELPAEFIDWLKISNGRLPENIYYLISRKIGHVKIHHVYGLNQGGDYNQIDKANSYLKGNLNPDLIAFADDEGGNQFVVSLVKRTFGKIYYWDHETEKIIKIAKSILNFDSKLTHIETGADIDQILKKDDDKALASWLLGRRVDEKGEYDVTLIEEASIKASIKCIKLLHSMGAELGDSLEFAERNLEFFPKHQETVDFLKSLEK